MAPPASFANYPVPEEGPKTGITVVPLNNPVLRGYPLLVAGNIIARSSWIQKYLWNTAGFGQVKDIAALDNMPWRFHPCVTPLGETGPMLEFSPELLQSSSSRSGPRYYTANDYHQLYKAGKVTPLQVTEALLPLIRPGQQPAGLYEDAWYDAGGQEALALQGAKASTERWAAGKPLGILDGVPIGVKDELDVEGLRTHRGMKYNPALDIFKKQEKTLWPVKKLQDAGAVIVGKNTMHELGSETSGHNPSQSTPTNHSNTSYYTGGSTSGGASALGAGVVPIVVGADAGGSVRIPPSFCGVYGLKPSHHRTMVMPHTMAVTGPMAASAADLAIAYRVMSQPDPDCGTQGRFALSIPPGPEAPRVIGVYRDWWALADEGVARVCERAVDYLAKQRGYEVVDIEIPYLSEARLAHSLICIAEMAEIHRRRTSNPAAWLSNVGPANKLLLSTATQTPSADYLKANAMRELLMRHMAFLFQKHPGLLIVTPTTALTGWPRQPGDGSHGISDANRTIESMAFIFLANVAGTPAVTAPVGYVAPRQGEGDLPVGLMAMGEWGCEEQLLAWAGETEEYLHETYEGGRKRPETWLDVMDLVTKST